MIFNIKHRILENYKDPHQGLSRLQDVVRDLEIRKLPMSNGWAFKDPFSNYLWKLLAHFVFLRIYADEVLKSPGKSILIREFLTIPLFLSLPLTFEARKNLVFLCNHNLAFAKRRWIHKFSLIALDFLGYQFAVFEDAQAWSECIGRLPRKSPIVILHPCHQSNTLIFDSRSRSVIRIAFVGENRPEKPVEQWMQLLASSELADGEDLELLFCTPIDKVGFISIPSKYSLVDTTTTAQYNECLASVDIAILPYDRDHYSWRVSGVLSDVLSRGVIPVVKNIPGMASQVLVPTKVGVLFESEEDFLPAVQSAISAVRVNAFKLSLEAYWKARS